MTPVLEGRRLVRDLGHPVKNRILHGVDLKIFPGEFVSLTGFSGSGKSTLLYLLGVLDRPTDGKVFLDGEDVTTLGDDERAVLRGEKLGFVFQFHFLLPEFSVLENVALPMLRRGGHWRERARARAAEVLGLLNLSHLATRMPNQLSGGQQQRVSIARSIAHEPRILLADEPTGNLDSENATVVMDVLTSLAQKGATIVMVTHERSFAARTARQVVLKDGRVIEDIDQRPKA
jgi:lipoprotein-releasing system ATP-binding protein